MKYLVMECHPAYAVLMDEDSRFVRAANMHYTVGQTVTDPVLMKDTGASRGITHSRILRIAAAAACLLVLSAAGFGFYRRSRQTKPEPQSVVVMFEQTRYEMELNSSGEVVSVLSGDPEGQQSIDYYDGQHLSPASFIGTVLKESLDEGKIEENKTVQVYLSSDDEKLYTECKEQIETEAAKLRLNADVQGIAKDDPRHTPPEPEKAHDGTKPTAPPTPKDGHQPPKPENPPSPPAENTKPEPPAPAHTHAEPPAPVTPPETPAEPPVKTPDDEKPAPEPVTPPQPPKPLPAAELTPPVSPELTPAAELPTDPARPHELPLPDSKPETP